MGVDGVLDEHLQSHLVRRCVGALHHLEFIFGNCSFMRLLAGDYLGEVIFLFKVAENFLTTRKVIAV